MSDALSSNCKIHAVRLRPGDDLKKSIQQLAADNKWSAAVIVTCVGSLTEYNLRFANQKEGTSRKGHFEIVSLVGTVSDTSLHLHMSIADQDGRMLAGHLLEGNRIFTTAEIAIAELPDLKFQRAFDPESGYAELSISKRSS